MTYSKVSLILLSIFFLLFSFQPGKAGNSFNWNEVLDKHGSIMMLMDAETGYIVEANQSAAAFYGYSIDELKKMNIEDINVLSDKEVEEERMKAARDERNFFVFSHELANKEIRNVEVYSYPYEYNDRILLFSIINDITARLDAKKEIARQKDKSIVAIILFLLFQFLIILFLIKNIIKRKASEKEIKRISFRDKLTGLYNRKFIEEQFKKIESEGKTPVSVIMIDVNGLKLTNDTYGHSSGDELLKSVAEILKSSCRTEDYVARWGGDEFIILLLNTGGDGCEKIIKRIKKYSKDASGGLIPISVSLGYSVKEYSYQDIHKVLQKAEDNMYKEKSVDRIKVRNIMKEKICKKLAEKTSETEEHIVRMKKLANEFAQELDLDENDIERLDKLVSVHDIGKISIPFEILNKEGDLSQKEWEILKTHPEIGYRIAFSIDDLVPVAEEILSHHEHWDGSGYPKGLKGEEIPVLARIINIIESYDVLRSERPYNKAKSHEEAIRELKKESGTKYDPELFERFIKLF
ncbi:bifunctional diguanylate cyclase/phosphohydrolase [Natronospora cellulosivora (SeqCode)]